MDANALIPSNCDHKHDDNGREKQSGVGILLQACLPFNQKIKPNLKTSLSFIRNAYTQTSIHPNFHTPSSFNHLVVSSHYTSQFVIVKIFTYLQQPHLISFPIPSLAGSPPSPAGGNWFVVAEYPIPHLVSGLGFALRSPPHSLPFVLVVSYKERSQKCVGKKSDPLYRLKNPFNAAVLCFALPRPFGPCSGVRFVASRCCGRLRCLFCHPFRC